MVRGLLFVLLIGFVFNPASGQENPLEYSLFFIGDAGEQSVIASPMGAVLRSKIATTGPATSVIYLGDNIYPKGLPPLGNKKRESAENVIRAQVHWIEGSEAKGIFLPGNHDWQKGGREGYSRIVSQARFLDSLHVKNLQFLPRDGCPGPVELEVGKTTILVILDTQWLLHGYERPGLESTCDAKTIPEVIVLLEDIFRRNEHKRIIVAAHHPLITYGEHGGVATAKDHIFPLTQLSRGLYIPLPIVGSLYPLYRKWIGDVQDTSHPLYRELSKSIQAIMKKYPGSIYAAGHEHALEYIVKDSTHFIVSGSGSKTSFVRKKKYAQLAKSVTGFVQVSIQASGGVVIHFWQVDDSVPEGKIIFSDTLKPLKSFTQNSSPVLPDFSAKKIRIKASDQYHAGNGKKRLFGENYRQEWATETEVPYFDLGTEKGGLKVLQKGGGMQTLSLRLEDVNGREYVLRSVEKYPESAVPEMFRKTFAQDLVQDQISASHPYAALVVPGLAEGAGIYHTNPRLVYIPNDPRLGEYRREFADRLALFEERPAGDWSDKAFFGNSEKIINTSKVLEKVQKDNDNRVDQAFVLQSRLFDLWIGDWDRHDDQWRWATFESKKKETYRPIPRDRDQAFFLNEGTLAKLWSRKWALPKFEGFDGSINWPSGLSFNARYFDRSFLTELSKDDWINIARDLEQRLTDSLIEKSIGVWPPEIVSKHGDRIIKDLKSRRAQLLESAISHYRFLAREVDVVGSDKPEWFDVERMENEDVLVTMYKITKDGEKGSVIYNRLFKNEETREVRLFCLGGDDVVIMKGEESNITIRVIGGDGEDKLTDTSGEPTRTIFYDREGEGTIVNGSGVKDRMSYNPRINEYDRRAFKYNKLAPLLFGAYNQDDGIFVGGGFVRISQGFRKEPFKSRHLFLATIAPLTASFNFRYQGKYTKAIGKWDFEIDLNLKAPNYVNNFFGLGNESVFDRSVDDKYNLSNDISYYRFRFVEMLAEAFISRRIGHSGSFRIGPSFQRIELEEPEDEPRYIEEYASELSYDLFEDATSYAGVAAQFMVDKRNDPLFASRGVFLNISSKSMAGLDERATSFTSIESSLSLYHTFRLPARVVFALRVGGGKTFGGYEFYQAQILDGRTELRGFRKTRFYGDSKLFTNIEMRIKLGQFKSYLFPSSFGIIAFQDGGRVWYSDGLGDPTAPTGKSSVWHIGWGGGIWFTPFNFTVLSLEAGHSKEGTLGIVRFGFMF